MVKSRCFCPTIRSPRAWEIIMGFLNRLFLFHLDLIKKRSLFFPEIRYLFLFSSLTLFGRSLPRNFQSPSLDLHPTEFSMLPLPRVDDTHLGGSDKQTICGKWFTPQWQYNFSTKQYWVWAIVTRYSHTSLYILNIAN